MAVERGNSNNSAFQLQITYTTGTGTFQITKVLGKRTDGYTSEGNLGLKVTVSTQNSNSSGVINTQTDTVTGYFGNGSWGNTNRWLFNGSNFGHNQVSGITASTIYVYITITSTFNSKIPVNSYWTFSTSITPVVTTKTVTISHWTMGWKNGEGNNGNKTAYNLAYTTFQASPGSSVTFDTSRGVSYPRGFYLRNICGHSSYNNGTWRTYDMPVTLTQPNSDTGMQYDYPMVDYNINYKLNGGTNNANNPSTYTVVYGETLQNPTRTGYTFAGWDITYHPDNIVAAANTNNWHWIHMHSAVVPGITYKVHVGKAWVTAGSANRFSVIIYDFTSGTSLAYFELPFGEDINFEITCPSSADISHRINLICYTGVSGSAANIGVTWEDIFITAKNCNLINRGVNIASFSSVSELNSVVSADYRDINSITCEAKWVNPTEAYIKGPIPDSTNCYAVDYIESTGTQYIDSGINPVTYNSHLGIEVDFEPTVEDSAYHSILASCYGDNNGTWAWSSQFNFCINNSNIFAVELPGGTGTTANRSQNASGIKARKQRHKIQFFATASGSGIDIDGAYKWQADTGITGGPNKNLYIFTRSYVNEGQYTAADYTLSAKLYSLKIMDMNNNGALLRDFIPCYNTSTNKAGLWDKVSKQFFGNIGTGNFNYPGINYFIKGKVFYKSDGEWVAGKKIYHKDPTFGGKINLSLYTPLTYVASGANNGYTNLNFSDEAGVKVKAKVEWDSFASNYTTMCGAQDATGSMANGANSLIMKYSDSPTYAWYVGNANDGGSHAKFALDYEPHIVETSTIIGDSYMKIDNDVQYFSTSTTRGTQPIYVFALNNGGYPGYYAQGKIYWLKLYDHNGTLVRDLVPCKRISDNIVGLLDVVNNYFYVTQSNGAFIGGSELSDWHEGHNG